MATPLPLHVPAFLCVLSRKALGRRRNKVATRIRRARAHRMVAHLSGKSAPAWTARLPILEAYLALLDRLVATYPLRREGFRTWVGDTQIPEDEAESFAPVFGHGTAGVRRTA